MPDLHKPRATPVSDRRFLIFQLSKYTWGLFLASLLGTVAAAVHSAWPTGTACALISALIGYAAFRMTNQYRCTHPACNQLLVFAQGTSAGSGLTTSVTRCPFCGVDLA